MQISLNPNQQNNKKELLLPHKETLKYQYRERTVRIKRKQSLVHK